MTLTLIALAIILGILWFAWDTGDYDPNNITTLSENSEPCVPAPMNKELFDAIQRSQNEALARRIDKLEPR
jgi:hypothetical protein